MTEANLRKLARDKPCFIRVSGCDGGGATTVLAHYRMAGICGMGMKPPDVCACPACHSCHDRVDGRTWASDGKSRADMRLAHAEGVVRWLSALHAEGYRMVLE